MRLRPPLGLLLGEISEGGVVIDEILPGYAAEASGDLELGDSLVAIEEEPVRCS